MAERSEAVYHFLVSVLLVASCFRRLYAAETLLGTCGIDVDLVDQNMLSGVLKVPMPESMARYQDPTLNLHCDIRIRFESGLQLQIELYRLDIMPVSADQTVCSTGLEVFETYTGRNIYGGRLCMEGWEWEDRHIERQKEKKVVETSPLTFRLVSEGPYRGTGFEVHFNVFRPNSVCFAKEFRCREFQRCVGDELACDGWNDCGDDSDESEDAGCGLLTASEIVALVVGIILFLETIIITVLFSLKYRRLARKYRIKSQISLASSNQNLKPIPEPVLSFPHRFNSMESMNKSNYSRRTGTRRDSDSSIDKNELEKSDRYSYKDNASERSYRSRQSESRRNGPHYQKRRSRGSSPASLSREKVDPVSSSLKGSQPDLGMNSDRDTSDKDKVYRDSERDRDRGYRDNRRDDRYSDSDDRSPSRHRRSPYRRRYDRSSEDDDYDSDYKEDRRRRRRRRSQDRYSHERYRDDSDFSDGSDYEREPERRRRSRHRSQERHSRDRYDDDPDYSDDSDMERRRRRRRRSRDRYSRDDRDYSDEDRFRDRPRRSSRERGRDRYEPEPDSYDDEDYRPRRRRKPSQEKEKRRDDYDGDTKYNSPSDKQRPERERDKRRDDLNDDSSSQPSYREQAPNQGRERERGRSGPAYDVRRSPDKEREEGRRPNERRSRSRENIISPQNHVRNSRPATPPKGEDLRMSERPRNGSAPSQPLADDSERKWKPRSERRKGRSQDGNVNENDSPPPVYEDIVPRVQLENLGYREEAV